MNRARSLILALAAASLACAPAPHPGESVHIADETAIIIWDAKTGTQHFIRRASFETKAKDFGFLVPTPSVPRLEEADDAAFDHLKWVTRPKVVYRTIPEGAKAEAAKAAAVAPAPPVKVVAEATVAGYDAAVLEAADAVALNDWLKQHGYVSSPDLVEWFKPYIAQKWKITAFKISNNSPGIGRADPKAVRMSFAAKAPYFPYREPANLRSDSTKGKDRLLRVFLLADARYGGTVGKDGPWAGETVWSGKMDASDHAKLLEKAKLPADAAPGALWLTEFEDQSSPRPGTDDLFFKAAADQSAVTRPDQIVYYSKSFGVTPAGSLDVRELLITAGTLAALLYAAYRLLARAARSRRSR